MTTTAVSLLIFVIAMLYAMVGLAGASGYLAALSLAGVDPAVMKPTALALNVVVATIATARYGRAGGYSPALFGPLAATAIPASYLGGAMALPGAIYRPLVGVVLLIAAANLLRGSRAEHAPARPRLALVLAAGAGIGLVSGLAGTGGGIFLIPLLLTTGWAAPAGAAGLTAAFVLVTSLAALLGHLTVLGSLPAPLAYWAPAAALGGWIGAGIGRRRAGGIGLQRLLAAILVVAAARLLLPA